MKKEVIAERVLAFILVMMVLNVISICGLFPISFEIILLVFCLWFFPLIGILVWLWYFEEY